MNRIELLCTNFARADRDARGWQLEYPDEDDWESPDCDVMSQRFIDYCALRGIEARLVKVRSDEDAVHYFAVVGTTAVDWTAKQFYNVLEPPVDPDGIPCPLIFTWPGRYPVSFVTLREEASLDTT